MNIFTFLKSKRGAINKLHAATLALSVGAGGMFFYNYIASSDAAQEQKVRNLSSIFTAGGQVPTEYSSINVATGATRFATAEERAQYEGTIFDGGEGAEDALNRFSFGSRALGSGEDGLGTGGVDATEIGGRGGSNMTDMPDGSAVGAAVRSSAQRAEASAARNGFQTASITRASGGSNLSAGSGYSGNGGSSATASALKAEGSSRVSPSGISGSMPSGSTLVSSKGFQGAHASSYRGGNRDGRIVGQGINSSEGKGLHRIAVNSGKVAADANRRANAGVDPIMNETYNNPGVVQLTGGETLETKGVGNDSFNDNLNKSLRNAKSNFKEIDTSQQKQKKRRTEIGTMALALLWMTLGAFFGIIALMKAYKAGGIYAVGCLVAAIAIGVVMAAAIAFFEVKCGTYIRDYADDKGVGIFGCIAGGVYALAIAAAYWIGISRGAKLAAETKAAAAKGAGLTEVKPTMGQKIAQTATSTLQSNAVSKGVEFGQNALNSADEGALSNGDDNV